jgi:hypothetical protein
MREAAYPTSSVGEEEAASREDNDPGLDSRRTTFGLSRLSALAVI